MYYDGWFATGVYVAEVLIFAILLAVLHPILSVVIFFTGLFFLDQGLHAAATYLVAESIVLAIIVLVFWGLRRLILGADSSSTEKS
jgi:hypothetical protein